MLTDTRMGWVLAYSGPARDCTGDGHTQKSHLPSHKQGSLAHLVPIWRVRAELHLPLHPLQVGLQEALKLLTVADFVLEGATVIDHRVHPVHVDELWRDPAALCRT